MRPYYGRLIQPLLAVLLSILVAGDAAGQSRSRKVDAGRSSKRSGARKWDVVIEILTGPEGIGSQAQRWRPVFENLGVSVRIRQGTSFDKIETRQKKLGPLRRVYVTGQIDRRGRIAFADRSFATRDGDRLREWIRELQTYGPQGAPEGKPLWGLDAGQFEAIFKVLTPPVANDSAGMSLDAALVALDLPAGYPLRITTDAQRQLRRGVANVGPVGKNFVGVSRGTSLAMLLSDYGLGFRPLRTPEGTIEFVVDPLDKTEDVWPVGWNLPADQHRTKVARPLFDLIPVEVDDVKLVDVLDGVSAKSGIAIRVDNYRIRQKGIDVGEIRVSYPRRQASWSQLLRVATIPYRLKHKLRIDEQGLPFVWVTTLEVEKPQR